jgi:tRNA/tmRNA/rRNA uracil-C5-methylase (TrmA/RlmC/RlmD family)
LSDLIELDIEQLVYGGKGLGRYQGQVIFVPGALPGERVAVTIRKEHKSFSDAELIEIITPSSAREKPVCPLALGPKGKRPPWPVFCAGCRTQHLSYSEEVALKQEQFKDLLQACASSAQAAIHEPLASPRELGYRNKITLNAARDGSDVRLGYIHEDNKSLLDIESCPLAMDELNILLKQLREKPGFLHSLRDGMQITLRYTDHDGAIFWRGRTDPKGVWLREQAAGMTLSVPRGSFFQVNPGVRELLLKQAEIILAGIDADVLIDLFCGVGVFALLASGLGRFKTIRGLDSDSEAIKAAQYNATQLKSSAEFIDVKSSRGFKELSKDLDGARCCVVVDPPRTGLDNDTRDRLTQFSPDYILYVSCAADTLVRDIAHFEKTGYQLAHTQLVDMFPRTAHFESISLLRLG